MFTKVDAYKDILNYLREMNDEDFVQAGTTREAVLNDEEKLEHLAAEHYKCVTQYGVDREWSCRDACESAPGLSSDKK